MGDVIDPLGVPSADELNAALDIAQDFWQALADDDDATTAALLMPELHAHFGIGEGLAARIRDAREVDRDACANIGIFWPVPILERRAIRPFFVPTDGETRFIAGGETVRGWSFEVHQRGGRWLVHPQPRKTLKVIGHLALSGSGGGWVDLQDQEHRQLN